MTKTTQSAAVQAMLNRKKPSLAELAAAFAKPTGGGGGNWKQFFPFFKMNVKETATTRFLPDLDEDSPMGYLVEKRSHDVKINGHRESILCGKAHGDGYCPFCDMAAKWYGLAENAKNSGDTDAETQLRRHAKQFYHKKAYVGQVLVVETNAAELAEEVGEVKLVEIGPQLFKNMQAAFQSGDMDNEPYDLEAGYNFVFRKEQKGQYANYDTSSFRTKPSKLTDEQLELVVQKMQSLKGSLTLLSKPATKANLDEIFSKFVSEVEQAAPAEDAEMPAQAAEPAAEPAAEAPKPKVSDLLKQRKNLAA